MIDHVLKANSIWTVTMADADWVVRLAEEQYGRPLDQQGCKDWIADMLTNGQSTFFARSDHAAGVAVAQRAFFDPNVVQVHMLYLVARKNRTMAGYRMLLAMAAWAKDMGASSFHFGSTTQHDLSPLAKRMARYGVLPDRQTWTLHFQNP